MLLKAGFAAVLCFAVEVSANTCSAGKTWVAASDGGTPQVIAGSKDRDYGRGDADGRGIAAKFNRPSDIAISFDKKFALVAGEGNVIRHIDLETMDVTTLAGKSYVGGMTNGPCKDARFNSPEGIDISPDMKYALIAEYHLI